MLQPTFLDTPEGGIFIQQFVPYGVTTGDSVAVLFVPPFAEELNKSRRMMANLGRALCQQQMPLCVPDLYGTGDSAGDFSEATWSIWRDNLATAARHLVDQGATTLHIVGLRMGALLAADLSRNHQFPIASLTFWQPVLNGQQLLNQFLRLRVAAGMISGKKETVAGLRERLVQSGLLEVAGYEINAQLLEELDRLQLAQLVRPPVAPIHWLEIQSGANTNLPLPVQKLHAQWQEAGLNVHLQSLPGEAFWSAQEICEVPELVELTVQQLGGQGV